MFSLESWLIDDQKPKIMPAVYNFFNYLGNSNDHSFEAIIFHPSIEKTVNFPNGSKINIHKLDIPFHYLRKYFSFHKMKHLGQNYIEKQTFDLIYGLTIYSIVAGQLGRNNKIKSVGRIFGSLIWDEMQHGSWVKLQTRFHFQLREAKNPPDILICTEDGTEFDKALAKLNPSKKVHMLYNGVDGNIKKQLLNIPSISFNKTEVVRLVSIGRLTTWKRHDISIEVIDVLKNKYGWSKVKLTILGKGEQKSNLQNLINIKNLQSQVTIQDPIPHESIPEFLSTQHIGLFMYDASNLGNALWETSLSGKLICTRPTGKTATVFTDGENAIIENDPARIAERISKIEKTEIVRLSQNSRKLIDELLPSWEDRFEKELDIIEKGI